MDRVVYYSPGDWAGGYNLEKAEEIIKKFDNNVEYEINELLEFYNILKYFENNVYLKKWSETQKESYKEIVKNMKKKVMKYFNTKINDSNIIELYKIIDLNYKENFFELFSKCINSFNIAEDRFNELINLDKIRITDILHYKNLTNRYSNELINYLKENYYYCAEIMIRAFLSDDEMKKEIFLPDLMNMKDKQEIINSYVNDENANLNYVKVVSKVSGSKDSVVITDKMKLNAKKKSALLEKKLFETATVKIEYGYGIEIKENQDKAVEIRKDGTTTCYSYSYKWLKENLDYPTILNNFIYLFEYVDPYFRINLVNKSYELGMFERLFGIKPKGSYNFGSEFSSRATISNMQMLSYYEFLNKNNIRIEDVIDWFFKVYIREEFDIENYKINMPSKDSSYFEKCKSILPEFDLILKEYKYYKEDGEIDKELIEMSSEHMFFENIPSLLNKKYIYSSNNDDIIRIQNYLFSDQCMLTYNPVTNKSYPNFYELLRTDGININDYNDYEKELVYYLIGKNLIELDSNNDIKIKNISKINIYADLYYNDVINYWKYPDKLRVIVDTMIEAGELFYENTLLSKPEQDYFDFHMNKRKFSDGYDLRNSNLHGTQAGDKDSSSNKEVYIILLKLMVLLIIKINDELCIYDERKKTGD